MNLDDQICYCYHVSARKLVYFAKRTCPQRPSQMTECLGAGTGCGWCIPFLKKIAESPETFLQDGISSEEYAAKRDAYIKTKQPKNTF
ncbi:MAG: (2Fe-2S)-binding protein [Phycisphaerales bacterium]|nr:(2Fe-2S)-binding protein [Phycisphaerales bacterium]